MELLPSSPIALYSFALLISTVIALIVLGTHKFAMEGYYRTLYFLVGWTSISSLFVLSGVVRSQFVPFGMIFFASVNIAAIVFAFSTFGSHLSSVPLWILIAFQSFRFPLELILHDWASTGTVPSTMSWNGQNFDIITGLLALGAFVPALRNKYYFWIFNIVGSVLLLNVIRVALLSSPVPFGWSLDRPLILAGYAPYHLIASVCVWSAIVGHILISKKLINGEVK